MMRRLVLLALLPAAAALAAPPQMLRVEWRWVEPRPAPATAAELAQGARVVSTQGSAGARPGVTLRTAPRAEPTPLPRELLVANGEPASVSLSTPGDAPPSLWLARGPKGDAGVLQPSQALSVESLAVRPRWPGGKAPVALEVAVQTAGAASGAQLRVATQVQAVLGAWTVVARSAAPVRELQLRVSLP